MMQEEDLGFFLWYVFALWTPKSAFSFNSIHENTLILTFFCLYLSKQVVLDCRAQLPVVNTSCKAFPHTQIDNPSTSIQEILQSFIHSCWTSNSESSSHKIKPGSRREDSSVRTGQFRRWFMYIRGAFIVVLMPWFYSQLQQSIFQLTLQTLAMQLVHLI